MQRRLYISETGKTEFQICFDTGLDPRSFARTKMSQSLIEPGFVVFPDGTHKEWKAAGVIEIESSIFGNGSQDGSCMRVFGQIASGKRLDLLLDECTPSETDLSSARQTALQAVISWIRAKLFIGDTKTALNPGASFILENGVFFAPEHLANRCLFIEDSKPDYYNSPDLSGINAAAFCAGIMLYKIFTGDLPYKSGEMYQDMREGIFLPPSLAVPEMESKLSELIKAALLLPAEKNQSNKTGTEILTQLLEVLTAAKTETAGISVFYRTVTEEEKTLIEKEKKNYYLKQNSVTVTKRFVTRNKGALIGAGIGAFFFLIITISIIQSIARRPTTEGLTSGGVIVSYYEAFSKLDHIFMSACVQGADKSDINAAASFFAVTKARQAYENTTDALLIPAQEWLENGGELPAKDVFGVTNLTLDFLSGSEQDGLITYRVNYLLWTPHEQSVNRTDTLTLRRDRRGNWRITDIQRIER